MHYIGTAGWNVRKDAPALFLGDGPGGSSHLQRYARGMNCVEINSTFYREHQPKTWARWAATVPDDFRFAVKAPQGHHAYGSAGTCGCGAAELCGWAERAG